MFAVGYLLGHIDNKLSYINKFNINNYAQEVKQISNWIKKNPYRTCTEIATQFNLSVRKTDAILTSLIKNGKIKRSKNLNTFIFN